MHRTLTAAALATILAPSVSPAQDINLSGQLDFGFRTYLEDGRFPGQPDAGSYPILGFRIDANAEVGPGEFVLEFSGLEIADSGVSSLDVQKAYYYQNFGMWDLVLGYNIENWGVSSAYNISNVLNGRDTTDQISGTDYIGTPMINANVFTSFGTFSGYLLFGDVRDNFGGAEIRRRGELPTDDPFTFYEDDDSVDFALRFSNNYAVGAGALDLGLYYYNGTAREHYGVPGCVRTTTSINAGTCATINAATQAALTAQTPPDDSQAGVIAYLTGVIGAVPAAAALAEGAVEFVPAYQEIEQYGLSTVFATGDLQLRFEGFVRDTDRGDFFAGIIGGDYTFNDFAGTGGTLTVGLEYLYDDRGPLQPGTVFEDDIFLGLNYQFNDASSTRLSLNTYHDVDTSARIYNMSFSRRLTEALQMQLNASHIEATGTGDTLATVDDDAFVELFFSVFF